MFEIVETTPDPDGRRFGSIRIGDFHERFALWPHPPDADPTCQWRQELESLLNDAPVVALRTDPHFAWLLYREDRDVFVQQMLLLSNELDWVDAEGNIGSIPSRCTDADVSEWRTTVAAIRRFLDRSSIP